MKEYYTRVAAAVMVIVTVIILFVLIAFGIVFVSGGSTFNSAFIEQCKTAGYWQSGQTRIICSVEMPKE
jgi:hypothetical protein